MTKAKKLKNGDLIHSSGIVHNRELLSEILKVKIPRWKNVTWSGDSTGGRINTDVNLRYKLVNLMFYSKANRYHYCYCTNFWIGVNNYLITNLGGITQHVTANSVDATGFNLVIPETIILHSIQYLDCDYE